MDTLVLEQSQNAVHAKQLVQQYLTVVQKQCELLRTKEYWNGGTNLPLAVFFGKMVYTAKDKACYKLNAGTDITDVAELIDLNSMYFKRETHTQNEQESIKNYFMDSSIWSDTGNYLDIRYITQDILRNLSNVESTRILELGFNKNELWNNVGGKHILGYRLSTSIIIELKLNTGDKVYYSLFYPTMLDLDVSEGIPLGHLYNLDKDGHLPYKYLTPFNAHTSYLSRLFLKPEVIREYADSLDNMDFIEGTNASIDMYKRIFVKGYTTESTVEQANVFNKPVMKELQFKTPYEMFKDVHGGNRVLYLTPDGTILIYSSPRVTNGKISCSLYEVKSS